MNSLVDHVIVEEEREAPRSLVEASVLQLRGVISHAASDLLAAEEPLEIQMAYGPAGDRRIKSISVTMRTPGDDFELAAGFLMTEGVVNDANDIERISYAAVCASSDDLRDDSALT